MIKARILIIEDDKTLLTAFEDNFKFAGYSVDIAMDGKSGLEKAIGLNPDLILLDIMLPYINGYELCRILREKGFDTPIIMITAKGQETDIILGLNLGADDYITKPFSINELLARVNAFLRRLTKKEQKQYCFEDFILNIDSRKFFKKDKEIILTPKEFDLLIFLIKNERRALTREQILNSVWGHDIFVTTRSVDRCITTLRQKIETLPKNPEIIQTVRHIGYRFECELK